MTEQVSPRYRSAGRSEEANGWAVGHRVRHYPLWSLLVIALDAFVIWALAAHGREVTT